MGTSALPRGRRKGKGKREKGKGKRVNFGKAPQVSKEKKKGRHRKVHKE